ncbi:mCG146144, partial [Mus musculus]
RGPDGQFRAPFKSPITTTTPTLLMGGCGTAENLPGGIPSGCTCVSQATPFLTHLRSSEELEGASFYVSNALRRSLPLNHLSLLPFHEASPSRRTPVAVPRSPPTGKPSHGAPFRFLRPGLRPLRPAPPRPRSAPARL